MDRSRDQTAELTKDVAARHESELAALRKESDERLTQAQTEAEQHTQAALEAVRSDHAEKIVTLENDRDSRIAALEARASRELGEAHDKLAKSEVDISGVRGELGSLRESKETGDAVNEARIADLEKRHGDLQGEVASLRKELGEAKDKLAGESSRADRAYAKWQADRQSLERAKDALAVALAHVEEPEGRPIG
jgi:chromosome segregation ATPase